MPLRREVAVASLFVELSKMGKVGEVTLLLAAAQQGQAEALDKLFELLYPELRRIAAARMRKTDERVMLDTTSLVHECYLRLLKLDELSLNDRGHFLAYAAKVMRSVVVDLAREQQAQRRGGDMAFVTLDTAVASGLPNGEDEVLHIHEALQALGEIDPRLVKVVEMRYFIGLDNTEIAQVLDVSTRTVERDWERARSFLFAALKS
jgi:RNA polymerase sigma factor (TIGR02999 family)